MFDRYEMDHAANLSELRRLLGLLGLRTGCVLLGGEELARLRRVASAGTIVTLPHAHAIEGELATITGRRTVATDLPVGFAGTSAFLRRVAAATGVAPERVEAAIDRELARAAPPVARVADRLKGLRVAVALDTPMAAAVTAWLTELGVTVPIVCLTDGEEADEAAFLAAAERMGAAFRERPVILAGASRNRALAAMRQEAARRPIPVVVGSSFHQLHIWGGWVVVEIGYPSIEKHWPYPMPWLGFNGAVALVQRLCDAVGHAF
jgi:nitrogenase molybdenum-iron protein alpha/beta subunit